jgi:hypothetical protein
MLDPNYGLTLVVLALVFALAIVKDNHVAIKSLTEIVKKMIERFKRQ